MSLLRQSCSTNRSTESRLSWPPRSQIANGKQWVASRIACQTSPIVDAHLSRLREVEVFGPGVTIVDDEFYFTPDPIATPLVLSAVVDVFGVFDVFTGDVPQDNRPLEDLFQFSHVVNSCNTFLSSLLPPLYFLPSCGSKSLAAQGAPEVFHNPLGHAVEVTISQRSQISRVRVSDGVEAVGNCGDRVGIFVQHTVSSKPTLQIIIITHTEKKPLFSDQCTPIDIYDYGI